MRRGSPRGHCPGQSFPDTSFADAARVTVQSARLLYGKAAADQVTQAFKARKIL
jgi:Zn-dependent metalloprotease